MTSPPFVSPKKSSKRRAFFALVSQSLDGILSLQRSINPSSSLVSQFRSTRYTIPLVHILREQSVQMGLRAVFVVSVFLVSLTHIAFVRGFAQQFNNGQSFQFTKLDALRQNIGLGIDLGTTNSVVTAWMGGDQLSNINRADEDGVELIPMDEKCYILPSLIHLDKSNGEPTFGNPIPDRAHRTTYANLKRLFALSEPPSSKTIELQSHLISHLLSKAETHLSKKYNITPIFDRIVVGVPTYFDELVGRAYTLEVVKAGHKRWIASQNEVPCDVEDVKIRLVREPEAAAVGQIYYDSLNYPDEGGGTSAANNDGELILVFDLGGGTYDLTLVSTSGENVSGGGKDLLMEIVATGGEVMLGGVDFDRKIAKYFRGDRHASFDGYDDDQLMMKIARECREKLSAFTSVDVLESCQVIQTPKTPSSPPPIHTLTRSEFEIICAPLFSRLAKGIREVCIMGDAELRGESVGVVGEEAEPATDVPDLKKMQQEGRRKARKSRRASRNLREEVALAAERQATPDKVRLLKGNRKISSVCFVGGCSKTPGVRRLVNRLVGGASTTSKLKPRLIIDGDEAIARGCGVYVGVLDGDFDLDKNANSRLGLEVVSPMKAAVMRAIIEQGRKLSEKSRKDDNDTSIKQGEKQSS